MRRASFNNTRNELEETERDIFEEVPVGETYILQLKSKRYGFTPDAVIFNLDGELTKLNFTAFEFLGNRVNF